MKCILVTIHFASFPHHPKYPDLLFSEDIYDVLVSFKTQFAILSSQH